MLSFITASNYFISSPHSFSHLNSPQFSSLSLETHFKKRSRNLPGLALVVEKSCLPFSGVVELRRGSCCKVSESDGDLELEGEILEFMKNSRKPNEFPTKKELVEAGRRDLADAIVRKGGWLSLGWDLDEEEGEDKLDSDFDIRDFQARLESCEESNSLDGGVSVSCYSSQLASPSGRSIEMDAEEDTGIEDILSRLERHRTSSLGLNLGKNGYGTYASSKDDGMRTYFGTSTEPSRPDKQPNCIVQRGGFSDMEFEVTTSNIAFDKKGSEGEGEREENDSEHKLLVVTQGNAELPDMHKGITPNQIKSRLQHLELELSSALHSLRSKSEKLITKGHVRTPSELQQLSDVWEFQENEVMNAQDRLRSIRAKLAVLEGKMALAIIDAQKIVEGKQRRIDSAHEALQLLRTACIVWPNSASEVLLAGSFDGWTTQRKMEKSRTGIFSVSLKLYPGKYEIKFIVDGIWRTDPLRPIVHNNGFENNILIIS